MPLQPISWPNGHRFAFSIIDDTDNATLANTRPVYSHLSVNGVFITKTVWPLASDPRDRFAGESLQDGHYRDYVEQLREEGHEIGYHGTRAGRSERSLIHEGLDFYRECLGVDPRVYAQHAPSVENIYWGEKRASRWPIGKAVARFHQRPEFLGDEVDSPYFWGDLCRERISYVRNFGFRHANVRQSDPFMPYHDPARPYVNAWFSSSGYPLKLSRLDEVLTESLLDEWERTGACVILGGHLGQGFSDGRSVSRSFARGVERLARRNGWFAPAGDLLDHIGRQRAQRNEPEIHPLRPSERLRLELRWTRDLGQKVLADRSARLRKAA